MWHWDIKYSYGNNADIVSKVDGLQPVREDMERRLHTFTVILSWAVTNNSTASWMFPRSF